MLDPNPIVTAEILLSQISQMSSEMKNQKRMLVLPPKTNPERKDPYDSLSQIKTLNTLPSTPVSHLTERAGHHKS